MVSRETGNQTDLITGPRDLQSTTCYLNTVQLRNWDHSPVVAGVTSRTAFSAAVKATTTAPGTRTTFRMPGNQAHGDGGGKMQESSCQCERPSQSTCVQRLVVKKLWVGRGPTTAKDAATIRTRRRRCKGRGIDEQRRRGDSLVQMRERKVQMTVDRVLRAQGK